MKQVDIKEDDMKSNVIEKIQQFNLYREIITEMQKCFADLMEALMSTAKATPELKAGEDKDEAIDYYSNLT